MALLTPNTIYKINGVKVCEKIIPDGTRWKDANKAIKSGFAANALYKKQSRLTNNTGTVQWITIHNTDDLDNVEDDAEQYTRATYNENMGSAVCIFTLTTLAHGRICGWAAGFVPVTRMVLLRLAGTQAMGLLPMAVI